MKIKDLLLSSILIFAAMVRLWNLGSIPPHLTPDEAALGYNAYSILKTGKDEYGEFMPIIFKSFGDYKPGLYIYLLTPFVAVFGLTEFAVRLPNALLGVLSVFLIFKVVQLIQKKDLLPEGYDGFAKWAPYFVSLALATNPWHINFSRGAWEANLSLTLTLLGIIFFIKALEKAKYLMFSSFFFALTLVAYQGAKLASFVVVFILVVVFWREFVNLLHEAKVTIVSSIVIGLFISIPILGSFFQGQTGRLNVFSIFSYPRQEQEIQSLLAEGGETIESPSYYVFHSEALNFSRGILGRFSNHFSGRFLFTEGDFQNPRHSAPNQGMLLLIDSILIPLGLYFLVRKRSKILLFITLWLLLAPLPAVLSRDEVHAVRAFNLAVPLAIISAYGLVFVISFLKKQKIFLKMFGLLFVTLIYVSALLYFLDAYFIHLSKHNSKLWDYGYKQIVETISPIQNNYERIKVQQSFAQPYIYFLFYQKYDPARFQKQAKLQESEYKGDVGYVTKLDNIDFVGLDWTIDRGDIGSLVAADILTVPVEDSSDPTHFTLINEIKYLSGEVAFRVLEVNN